MAGSARKIFLEFHKERERMLKRRYGIIAVFASVVAIAVSSTGPAQAETRPVSPSPTRIAFGEAGKPTQGAQALTGPWHIRNRHSDKCLAVLNASTADNVDAVQYTCDYSYPFNEEWWFDGYHIVNGHSGKCLAIKNASTDENAVAVQYTCDFTAPFNENWVAEDISPHDDFWHITNVHSRKCLAIKNVSTANNARAVQFSCDFSAPFNEEWYFEPLF